MLEAVGFSELSVESVAYKAGVGKATVYRWWPNKAALVADSFASSAIEELRFPDTGSLRTDLSIQMSGLVRVFRSRRGKLVSALIGGGQSDAELIDAFRERFLRPRREEAYRTLRRAVERGEMSSKVDFDLVLDALYGPIYMRFLIGHGLLNREFVLDLSDLVLAPVLLGGKRNTRRVVNRSRPSGTKV